MKGIVWRGLRLAAAAPAGFVVACTLKVVPPDPGSDASATGGTQTVDDQCKEISTELCSKAQSCAVGGDPGTCVNSYVDLCCVGSVCDEISKSPPSAVDACKSAIDTEDCNALVNGEAPAACQGVPQKP